MAHLQYGVVRGVLEHALAGAVAQYESVLVDVVIPGGQFVYGMQYVSTVEPPGPRVMLYHWSRAQEHCTTERDISVRRQAYLTPEKRNTYC